MWSDPVWWLIPAPIYRSLSCFALSVTSRHAQTLPSSERVRAMGSDITDQGSETRLSVLYSSVRIAFPICNDNKHEIRSCKSQDSQPRISEHVQVSICHVWTALMTRCRTGGWLLAGGAAEVLFRPDMPQRSNRIRTWSGEGPKGVYTAGKRVHNVFSTTALNIFHRRTHFYRPQLHHHARPRPNLINRSRPNLSWLTCLPCRWPC
jgi:hypothetical protein